MTTTSSILAALVALGSLTAPVALEAQQLLQDQDGGEVLFQARIMDREVAAEAPLVDVPGRYIVVHLAENRVFVFEGDHAIWSSQAGTGTGFKLETGQHHWLFTTPRGLMKVLRMEKDPIWEAPDWHFVQKGLPIPPQNSPSRRIPGGMGTTALYLGDGIAIHGTGAPELVLRSDPERRRVSHGCIRLTNEAARELMHMVDVGTPVLIF